MYGISSHGPFRQSQETTVPHIALHLLDATQNHPLQSWEFEDLHEIRIGRATDNDVQIGSPFVSRSHAFLQWNEGQWELRVPSQNGAVVDGKKVFHCDLEDNTVFQLGPGGPYLRFHCFESDEESQLGMATMFFDQDTTPLLVLDPTQRDQEVEQIVKAPYFQRLQEMAEELRQRRRIRH